MGLLSDKVEALQVSVVAPSGRLSASLTGYSHITPSFTPGAYRRYTEQSLEEEISRVASLLFTARTRAYVDMVSEAFGSPMKNETQALSPRDVAYEAARSELVIEAQSGDGNITLSARGLRSWSVHLARGTLQRLTEDEFVEQLAHVARVFVVQQMDIIRALKDDIYQRQDL
jgi:hypothetical protein